MLIPRGLFKRPKNDPYIKAREAEQREAALVASVLDAIASGQPHAFIATDLLWLDGTPLFEVPLLERKRLLEGVLEPSQLVRITPFVRPSAKPTLVTWGAQGFAELSYRAANSHYTAGAANPDWVQCPPPIGAPGGSRGPTSPG
jgi:ATP-dependent DNA ligase